MAQQQEPKPQVRSRSQERREAAAAIAENTTIGDNLPLRGAPSNTTTSSSGWLLTAGMVAGGVFSIANGAWMLASPYSWYHHLPAGIPETGPLNHHFVRDIGAVYALLGAVMVIASRLRGAPATRFALVAVVAGFHVAHDVIHVWEVAAGVMPARRLIVDAPVHITALLSLLLLWPLWLDRQRSARQLSSSSW